MNTAAISPTREVKNAFMKAIVGSEDDIRKFY